MNRRIRLIGIFCLIFQVSGCTYYVVSFKDVSDDAPFSKAVGITVETTQDLIIYGYNLDSIPGKKIHEYSITNFPGPRNRYVLYRDRVPSGSKLNVVAVRRCSDCFLDSSPRVKIEIQSSYFGEVYQVPIYVDEKFLVKSWSSESKSVEINSEYFSRVD